MSAASLHLWYFKQDHCAPCVARKPVAEIIAQESGLPIMFADINDVAVRDLAQRYGVRSTPTLVLANHDGRLAGWIGNFINAAAVLKVIARFKGAE